MKVVCAILIQNEKVLIAQRKNGFFEFPGGKVEKGESEEQAIYREWKEECGIDIENVKFFKKGKDFQDGQDIDLTCFICTSRQTPVLHVHQQFIYTTPDHIYDYPFFEADQHIVEKLKKEWPCLIEQMKQKY
ncbi:MAG: (deoxy)nucleoside triphosphate pyrophosphohydrolase [Floccifex sp.]